jgi:hypothetical protein
MTNQLILRIKEEAPSITNELIKKIFIAKDLLHILIAIMWYSFTETLRENFV